MTSPLGMHLVHALPLLLMAGAMRTAADPPPNRIDAPLIYTGRFAGEAPSSRRDDIRVVSYNIHLGTQLKDLIDDLRALGPDLVMLQEVSGEPGGAPREGDRNAAEAIARALEMNYVFAPAGTMHGKEFGNAILSRWPIDDVRRTDLPSSAWEKGEFRSAVSAVATVNGRRLHLYSVHLSVTFPDSLLSEASRSRQLGPVLDDVRRLTSGEPIIVAGDLNHLNPFGWRKTRAALHEAGLRDLHSAHGATFKPVGLELDHAYGRGLIELRSGISRSATGSDHYPIWADLAFAGWVPEAATVQYTSPAPR